MSRERNEQLYAQWRDRVSRWKASGLTSEKFAMQEGLPRARALVAWSHKFRAEERAKKKRAPAPALPMRVLSVSMDEVRAHALPMPRVIEVTLAGGARLSVPADEQTMRAVFRALQVSS